MPMRTNDFQRLVYEVERLLADDARVTESKLLRDLVTGAKREVDVSVEVPVGGHFVTISIECRDQTRAADVTWVEQMKAKHERLLTNVLTLVSSSGFTPGALEVADRYGIETVSLEEVSADDAARIVGKLSSLWCKSVELSATECSVRVEAVQGLPVDTFKASPDLLVFAEDGSEIGFLLQYVDLWLRSPEVMRRLLDLVTETTSGLSLGQSLPSRRGSLADDGSTSGRRPRLFCERWTG
jgi:hypothetical protein